MYIYIYTYIYTNVHIHIHIHIHMYIYIYIYVYMYTHSYARPVLEARLELMEVVEQASAPLDLRPVSRVFPKFNNYRKMSEYSSCPTWLLRENGRLLHELDGFFMKWSSL